MLFFLPQAASATVYYVDFTNGSDANAGTASSSAFQTVTKYVTSARAAGDIAFVRRGMATTTGLSSVTFLSNGTLNQPIFLSSDYDNVWGDFATSSQTFTPVYGSQYMGSSASTTDAFPNKWIYVAGDCSETLFSSATTTNKCAYAYEIKAASSTGIQLYLPYKGSQSGSGNNLRVMPANPIIGLTSDTTFSFVIANTSSWSIKGLDLRSSQGGGVLQPPNNRPGGTFMDMILQGDGVSDGAINNMGASNLILKTRTFGQASVVKSITGGIFKDDLFDCNNVSASIAFTISSGQMLVTDSTITGCTSDINFASYSGNITGVGLVFRNVLRKGVVQGLTGTATVAPEVAFFQDDFGIVGLNSQTSNQISSDTISTTTISDTANLRAGGGPTNILIRPPTGTGNTGVSDYNFPISAIKIFEYPIYAGTGSKTYSLYFMSTSTSNFTSNPLTSTASGSSTPELFIECEYYSNSTGATRKLIRSNAAAAINFTGSTAWQAVSVTCQPSQSGVLFLRGWYAKPNDGKSNWFFMDTTPVVS